MLIALLENHSPKQGRAIKWAEMITSHMATIV